MQTQDPCKLRKVILNFKPAARTECSCIYHGWHSNAAAFFIWFVVKYIW